MTAQTPIATEPRIVDVPDRHVLMLEGIGEPGGAEFARGVSELYAVSADLNGLDRPVPPLEALFAEPAHGWRWTLLLEQAPDVTQDAVDAAIERLRPEQIVVPIRVRWFHEGLVAELLHVGPHRTEAADIDRLVSHLERRGYVTAGLHHEVYLDEPARTPPGELRTILRRPIAVDPIWR